MKRYTTLAALAVLAVFLFFSASQAQPSVPVRPLRFAVHPETTYQIITGFGSGFNEAAEQLMETIASPTDRAKAYDLLSGESGARLNIIRLTISPIAQAIASETYVGYDWAHDAGTQSKWAAIQPILHPVATVLRPTKPILYAVPFTPPAQWKDKYYRYTDYISSPGAHQEESRNCVPRIFRDCS